MCQATVDLSQPEGDEEIMRDVVLLESVEGLSGFWKSAGAWWVTPARRWSRSWPDGGSQYGI